NKGTVSRASSTARLVAPKVVRNRPRWFRCGRVAALRHEYRSPRGKAQPCKGYPATFPEHTAITSYRQRAPPRRASALDLLQFFCNPARSRWVGYWRKASHSLIEVAEA